MGFLKRAIASRVAGDRPSVPAALAAAVVAGAGVGVVVYRLLRSE
ncbi:MAG: hypothetical protein WKF40_01295 [Thermoleophilaceae bacterium]